LRKYNQSETQAILNRLYTAMNEHDLETLVGCFHPDYRSKQPVHPERNFTGTEQVRRNWTGIFEQFSDFQASIINQVIHDDTAWIEWEWTGTSPGADRVNWRGITILGVEKGVIRWGRLYMEETPAGEG
jgi:ketosteroid isomerase-like protein